MAQKIGELPLATTVTADEKTLIYNLVTEETKLLDPMTLTDGVSNIVHTDVSSEIDGVTAKGVPHASDILLIEDSEDSFSKKKIPLSTLGGGAGGIPDAPVDGNAYVRKDGAWVDSIKTARVVWEASGTPPEYQNCLVDNVTQVVTFSSYPSTDPAITVDLGLGEVSFVEDLDNVDIHVNLQIHRDGAGGADTEWGIAAEVWDGVSWTIYPNSSRHFTFDSNTIDAIRHLSFSISVSGVLTGTKFRLIQVAEDASNDIGLVSDKPFTALPQSAGLVMSMSTR